MPTVLCGAASLAVASLFYAWRAYHEKIVDNNRRLHERVAYMLWVVANGAR